MTTDLILRLESASLLSKYGFNDGDEPDDISDQLVSDGFDYLTVPWKPALRALVRAYLLPALDQKVEAVDIITSHNPIRACSVDGVEVDLIKGSGTIKLTPEYVEVPYALVLEAVRTAVPDDDED